jgi:hypothetical protein
VSSGGMQVVESGASATGAIVSSGGQPPHVSGAADLLRKRPPAGRSGWRVLRAANGHQVSSFECAGNWCSVQS